MLLLFNAEHTPRLSEKCLSTSTFVTSPQQNTVNGACGHLPSGPVADCFHHLLHLIVMIHNSCCEGHGPVSYQTPDDVALRTRLFCLS